MGRGEWERPYSVLDQYRDEDHHYGHSGPVIDEIEAAELNDVGHEHGCDCPRCLPEAHDEAETERKVA